MIPANYEQHCCHSYTTASTPAAQPVETSSYPSLKTSPTAPRSLENTQCLGNQVRRTVFSAPSCQTELLALSLTSFNSEPDKAQTKDRKTTPTWQDAVARKKTKPKKKAARSCQKATCCVSKQAKVEVLRSTCIVKAVTDFACSACSALLALHCTQCTWLSWTRVHVRADVSHSWSMHDHDRLCRCAVSRAGECIHHARMHAVCTTHLTRTIHVRAFSSAQTFSERKRPSPTHPITKLFRFVKKFDNYGWPLLL